MKGSKIWGVGKHHLYINKEPTWVYVSKEALEKDYTILKANLPIPIGIDHLDEKLIKENKILQKMDLLNVGSIEDVELKEDGIHILEAKITNPLIQELHDQQKLPAWSIVSAISLSECETGKVDYVEDYSIINRVDFVEKGACTSCNVEYANGKLAEAKSIIGDIMAEDGKENNEDNNEPTMTDVMKGITDLKEEQETRFDDFDDRIKALEDNNDNDDAEANDAEGSSEDNKEIKAVKEEIAEMKAEAVKTQTKAVVEGYVKEGKIKPKDIEKHMNLALASMADYKDIMADAPVVVEGLGERLSTAEGAEAGSQGSDDEYSDEDFKKDFEAAYGKEE